MLNFRFLLQVVLHIVIVFVVIGSGLSCHGGNSVVPPIPKPPVYPRIDDSPAWSPDGERIIYYHYGISHINIDGSYDINPDSVGLWMINADGTNPRLILKGMGKCARWSPDGNWIVFEMDGQIYKARIVGDKVDSIVQLTTEGRNFFPAWSSDGRWIVYTGDSSEIWVMRSDGTEKRRIVAEGMMPDLSPNGNYIIFVGLGPSICRVNLSDTSKIFRLIVLTRTPYAPDRGLGHPRYSPDGAKIVFDSDGIWIMNSDATNLKYLGLGDSPSWSPDGQKIVYIGSSGKEIDSTNGTVWVMNADGSDKRPLTYGPIPR